LVFSCKEKKKERKKERITTFAPLKIQYVIFLLLEIAISLTKV